MVSCHILHGGEVIPCGAGMYSLYSSLSFHGSAATSSVEVSVDTAEPPMLSTYAHDRSAFHSRMTASVMKLQPQVGNVLVLLFVWWMWECSCSHTAFGRPFQRCMIRRTCIWLATDAAGAHLCLSSVLGWSTSSPAAQGSSATHLLWAWPTSSPAHRIQVCSYLVSLSCHVHT
jgi:hypothetical protein